MLGPRQPDGVLRMVLAILIAALTGQWAGAQTPVTEGQRIIHQSWTFQQGAPEAVRAFAQTADGYLWVGAPAGLFRFDGIRFELFRSPFGDQLHSTNVSALFAPRTGGLWVGYVFGGFSFLMNGRVTNFVQATGTVRGFAQDRDGIMWAATPATATRGGLWRFDGSSWQQIGAAWNAPEKSVDQMGFDREGILWVLTGRQPPLELYYLLPGERQFRKAGANLLVAGFTSDADRAVLTTHEKTPRGPGSGIELESSLPAYPILRKDSNQFLDRANSIWLLPTASVILHHPASEPLAENILNASPANSEVYDIDAQRFSNLVDREGSVWIADEPGIHRFLYSPLIAQDLPKPPGPLFSLAADEGGVVWISAGDNAGSSTLYRVADGKVGSRKLPGGASYFAYRAPDKTVWFGGEGGLWHMVNGSLTRVELPQEVAERASNLTTITQDRSGGMWVSFAGPGLYRLKDGVWSKFGGRSDLPKSGVVIEFTDSLGRLWFGGTKNELAVLDGDRVESFGSNEGVQIGNITAIYGRGSEVWIGGEFGFQQFDHGRFHAIRSIDRESLRGISGIVETVNGDLWLNGLGGIFHIRQSEILKALKNPAYQVSGERFGKRDGLPGLPSQLRHMPTAIEGTDGRLWFTLNYGVVWIDPARTSNQTPPPPLTVQSVFGDDKNYRVDSPIRFPAHTSSVQISYAAVSLRNPEAIRFRYKLQETDKDWHEAATSNAVSFRNLSPGLYHFVVNASDTNGLWSGNTAAVEFTVLPAFYQTAWFRALLAAAMLALLWAGYRFRIRQLERVRQLESDLAHLNRVSVMGELAASIAHEVNQPLSGIVTNGGACLRWLAGDAPDMQEIREAVRDMVRDGKRAGEVIARVRALTRRAAARKEVLDVNETIREVLAIIGDEAKRKSVLIRTEFADDLPPVAGDRVQLQQVVLNLVMNAMEAMSTVGDRARELVIYTRNIDPGEAQVTVEDSGTGLDPDLMSKIFEPFYTTKSSGMGMGLSISRSIVQNHGGRLWATPNNGPGTSFHFTVPGNQGEDKNARAAAV